MKLLFVVALCLGSVGGEHLRRRVGRKESIEALQELAKKYDCVSQESTLEATLVSVQKKNTKASTENSNQFSKDNELLDSDLAQQLKGLESDMARKITAADTLAAEKIAKAQKAHDDQITELKKTLKTKKDAKNWAAFALPRAQQAQRTADEAKVQELTAIKLEREAALETHTKQFSDANNDKTNTDATTKSDFDDAVILADSAHKNGVDECVRTHEATEAHLKQSRDGLAKAKGLIDAMKACPVEPAAASTTAASATAASATAASATAASTKAASTTAASATAASATAASATAASTTVKVPTAKEQAEVAEEKTIAASKSAKAQGEKDAQAASEKAAKSKAAKENAAASEKTADVLLEVSALVSVDLDAGCSLVRSRVRALETTYPAGLVDMEEKLRLAEKDAQQLLKTCKENVGKARDATVLKETIAREADFETALNLSEKLKSYATKERDTKLSELEARETAANADTGPAALAAKAAAAALASYEVAEAAYSAALGTKATKTVSLGETLDKATTDAGAAQQASIKSAEKSHRDHYVLVKREAKNAKKDRKARFDAEEARLLIELNTITAIRSNIQGLHINKPDLSSLDKKDDEENVDPTATVPPQAAPTAAASGPTTAAASTTAAAAAGL